MTRWRFPNSAKNWQSRLKLTKGVRALALGAPLSIRPELFTSDSISKSAFVSLSKRFLIGQVGLGRKPGDRYFARSLTGAGIGDIYSY